MKKSRKTKIIIWSVIGLVIAGVLAVPFFSPKEQGAFEKVEVKKGNITTFYTFSGTVEAENRESVRSEKAMQIDKILVQEGDTIKKDDVLLTTSQGEDIKASIDGEVSAVNIEEDAQVMAGTELINIVDYSDLQANVKIDEYDLSSMEVDKQVDVSISALGKEVKGIVSSISKEAKNDNGIAYFTATIDLDENDDIRVGMSVEARVQNQSVSAVPILPMEAIQFDNSDNSYVLLPAEEGNPTRKYIKTGINDGKTVEIKEGLSAGDSVAIPSTQNNQGSGGLIPPRAEGISSTGGMQGGMGNE